MFFYHLPVCVLSSFTHVIMLQFDFLSFSVTFFSPRGKIYAKILEYSIQLWRVFFLNITTQIGFTGFMGLKSC